MPVAFETCWAESPAHFSQGNKDDLGAGTFPFQSFYSKNEASTPGPGQMGEKVPFRTPFSAKHITEKSGLSAGTTAECLPSPQLVEPSAP